MDKKTGGGIVKEMILAIAVIFLGIGMILNFIIDLHQPTHPEVITICEELIEADTLSIYSKNYQTFIESYVLVQALVLKGDLPVEKLQPYIDWLLNREEMRQHEARDKFEGDQ
jgi:hypothetical protein